MTHPKADVDPAKEFGSEEEGAEAKLAEKKAQDPLASAGSSTQEQYDKSLEEAVK